MLAIMSCMVLFFSGVDAVPLVRREHGKQGLEAKASLGGDVKDPHTWSDVEGFIHKGLATTVLSEVRQHEDAVVDKNMAGKALVGFLLCSLLYVAVVFFAGQLRIADYISVALSFPASKARGWQSVLTEFQGWGYMSISAILIIYPTRSLFHILPRFGFPDKEIMSDGIVRLIFFLVFTMGLMHVVAGRAGNMQFTLASGLCRPLVVALPLCIAAYLDAVDLGVAVIIIVYDGVVGVATLFTVGYFGLDEGFESPLSVQATYQGRPRQTRTSIHNTADAAPRSQIEVEDVVIDSKNAYVRALRLREKNFLLDGEAALELAKDVLTYLLLGCCVITFIIVRPPDIICDPIVHIGGYYNVCIAFDYYPSNYVAGLGYQFVQGLLWVNAWKFCKRARDAVPKPYESACVEDSALDLWTVVAVHVSGFVYAIGTPCMMLAFMVKPNLTENWRINAHTVSFEIWVVATAQWFVMNWYVAWKWHQRDFWFTFITIVYVLSSAAKLYYHELEMRAHFTGTKHNCPMGDIECCDGIYKLIDDETIFSTLSSPAQIWDLIWIYSLSRFAKWHVLHGYDPNANGQDLDRHGELRRSAHRPVRRRFAPYVKVDEVMPQEINKHTDLMMDLAKDFVFQFQRHEDERKTSGYPEIDEEWGNTIGIVAGTFTIDDRIRMLHTDLRVGFLKEPKSYEAVIRINCTSKTEARMAVRVALPEGMTTTSELPGAEPCSWADFLFAEDLKEFFFSGLSSMSEAMKVKNNPEGWGKLRYWAYILLHGREALEVMVRRKKQEQRTMKGDKLPQTGVFGKEYYGGLPFRLGPGGCKWGLRPRQNHIIENDDDRKRSMETLLSWSEIDGFNKCVVRSEGRYTKHANEFLEKDGDAVFDFCVQVATDEEHHLFGDPSHIWPEDSSPYVNIGTLTIPGGQRLRKEGLGKALCFNVKNQLKEHHPIGPLNIARCAVYKQHSAERLMAFNQCPVVGLRGDGACPM